MRGSSLGAANDLGHKSAFKAAVKVLEYGLVGYSASNGAAKIYNTICDEVVAEIGVIKGGDAKESGKKLGELGSVYNKKNAPSVAAEIESAKKEIKSAS
ncbi:MAG: hypothetical protein IT462_13680 [Planctomycetes bacterium]|nr:hypothetical protein [Planctomycetota bacterium]